MIYAEEEELEDFPCGSKILRRETQTLNKQLIIFLLRNIIITFDDSMISENTFVPTSKLDVVDGILLMCSRKFSKQIIKSSQICKLYLKYVNYI